MVRPLAIVRGYNNLHALLRARSAELGLPRCYTLPGA